jgi:hypothetical protein
LVKKKAQPFSGQSMLRCALSTLTNSQNPYILESVREPTQIRQIPKMSTFIYLNTVEGECLFHYLFFRVKIWEIFAAQCRAMAFFLV